MSYTTTATDSTGWDSAPLITPGTSGFDWDVSFDQAYPGYVVNGWQNTTADEKHPDFIPSEAYSFGSTSNLTTDPTVGSLPGMVDRLPYQYGPVDSNFVEDFTMTGAYISIRRRAEYGSGPVGVMDYSGILAAALEQSNASPYAADRMSAELLMAL